MRITMKTTCEVFIGVYNITLAGESFIYKGQVI